MEIKSLPPKVFGLRGIEELFGVKKNTAQRYKQTWLAPAVSQIGRVIVTDTALAMELFEKNSRKS